MLLKHSNFTVVRIFLCWQLQWQRSWISWWTALGTDEKMLVRSPDHTARQGQSQEEELDALITIQRVTGKKKIKRAQIAFTQFAALVVSPTLQLQRRVIAPLSKELLVQCNTEHCLAWPFHVQFLEMRCVGIKLKSFKKRKVVVVNCWYFQPIPSQWRWSISSALQFLHEECFIAPGFQMLWNFSSYL